MVDYGSLSCMVSRRRRNLDSGSGAGMTDQVTLAPLWASRNGVSAHRPPAAVNGARASALSSFDRSFVAVDGSGHFEADFFPAQAVTIDGVQQDIVRPQGQLGLLFQCDRLGLAIFDDRDDR